MEEPAQAEIAKFRSDLQTAWDHYYAERYIEATEICVHLIADHPLNFSAYYLRGHIYRMQDADQKAVDQFLTALQNDKEKLNVGYTCYWLGVMYGKTSWLKEAGADDIYDKEKSAYYYQQAKNAKEFPADALLHYRFELKGQERIEMCEEGISRFSDFTDFYVLLAEHYEHLGQSQLQLKTFKRALEANCASPSLFYNLGRFYYARKENEIAQGYFQQALDINEEYKGYNFAINFWLARIAEKQENSKRAEEIYCEIYVTEKGYPDCLFGFFGLINLYLLQENHEAAEELVLNFDANPNILDDSSRAAGGPVTFSEYVTDTIAPDNLEEIYKNLSKYKPTEDNTLLAGKVWLIKAQLAGVLNKPKDRYIALKKAYRLLNVYHYDFLPGMFALALASLYDNKTITPAMLKSWHDQIVSDVKAFNKLAGELAQYIQFIFKEFFDAGSYDKLVSLATFFTMEQVSEQDSLFMLAYAYNEVNDKQKATAAYELYLKESGDSSAVLNNLGNLYDTAGDHTRALELYNRGLAIAPDDKHLNNNHTRLTKKIALMEEQAGKDKQLKNAQQAALQALKHENDYVLEKLIQFIERIKKDEGFQNWTVPIQKYKFQKYIGVDKQRAESLLGQWLTKGYLTDTRNRDDFNVTIYAINPLIESEIKRLDKLKIPPAWISGFMGISTEVLDNKGYFALTAKAAKTTKKYKLMFERDINELYFNYLMGHLKATIVLSGSLVELALTYYCERKKTTSVQYQDQQGKTKTKNLYDCVLSDLISYAEQNQFFGSDFVHLSNLSRIYRNFVHPGRELKDQLDSAKADLCFISTIEILKKII